MISLAAITSAIEVLSKQNEDNYEECKCKHNFTDATIDSNCDMPYETFFKNYLIANKPCIISLKDFKNWKCRSDWINKGKPNFYFLKREFGSSIVPVADCNVKEYNSQKKKDMSFLEYIKYWELLALDTNVELLYLKDWHFKREYPHYNAYGIPDYFQSDWLNEFCETQDDDYQFVYMGPRGTWTPLHADVFRSYSWSINICGRKKWLLFPPGQEQFLRDERKKLYYKVDENYLKENQIFHYKVIQEAGEVIFVPSGWYHQVWNLEDTISINHNWFNGCNIHHIWQCLYEAAMDVENEITDCKEFEGWEDQCQIILKVHHGMNYADFLSILEYIVQIRIQHIKLEQFSFNHHFLFDLISMKLLCSRMISFKIPESFRDNINNLYLQIDSFIYGIEAVKHLTFSSG